MICFDTRLEKKKYTKSWLFFRPVINARTVLQFTAAFEKINHVLIQFER